MCRCLQGVFHLSCNFLLSVATCPSQLGTKLSFYPGQESLLGRGNLRRHQWLFLFLVSSLHLFLLCGVCVVLWQWQDIPGPGTHKSRSLPTYLKWSESPPDRTGKHNDAPSPGWQASSHHLQAQPIIHHQEFLQHWQHRKPNHIQ